MKRNRIRRKRNPKRKWVTEGCSGQRKKSPRQHFFLMRRPPIWYCKVEAGSRRGKSSPKNIPWKIWGREEGELRTKTKKPSPLSSDLGLGKKGGEELFDLCFLGKRILGIQGSRTSFNRRALSSDLSRLQTIPRTVSWSDANIRWGIRNRLK